MMRRVAKAPTAAALLAVSLACGSQTPTEASGSATPAAALEQQAATPTEPRQEPTTEEHAVPEPSGSPVRVLYLEHLPRWEYRYVKNVLVRAAGTQTQVFLIDASDDFPQESSAGLPPLERIPRTAAELAVYDVVLIGDVPAKKLAPTEADAAWFTRLVEFVAAGGGVGFLCGDGGMPHSYVGTPVEQLLPVEIESDNSPATRRVTEGFLPQLAEPRHGITALQSGPDLNARLWHEQLAPLMAYCLFPRARAGAEPVLLHPRDRNEHGPRVLAAAMSHGRGRTFVMGTDETWRWRFPYGEKYQQRFWLNVVRDLAQSK